MSKNSGEGGGEEPIAGKTGPEAVSVPELVKQRDEQEDEACEQSEIEVVESMRQRVVELEGEVIGLREALRETERLHEIERVLGEADAIDMETAVLLTELAVRGMDEPDVALAVEGLRRTKPFLFRRASPAGHRTSGAMASALEAPAAGAALGGLADEARMSGDRRALLRYLRERRG